jgi:hypothetical protein
MPDGICLVKMVFDQLKNHFTIIQMISQKCQLRLGQKVHGPITMDKFKTTCPK